MNVKDIFTGKYYVYCKPGKRHALLVEALASDPTPNVALVVNLNTRKTMQVNADHLTPVRRST